MFDKLSDAAASGNILSSVTDAEEVDFKIDICSWDENEYKLKDVKSTR